MYFGVLACRVGQHDDTVSTEVSTSNISGCSSLLWMSINENFCFVAILGLLDLCINVMKNFEVEIFSINCFLTKAQKKFCI